MQTAVNTTPECRDGLYHKLLGLPKLAARIAGEYQLQFSKHAIHAARNDRYGFIALPRRLAASPENLVEVEVQRGRLVKFVVRVPYREGKDLCLVIMPDGPGHGFVKTVWLNNDHDSHKTLNPAKYVTP